MARHPMAQLQAERIREIRSRLGLTQAEAGELLEDDSSSFAKYEQGDASPSASLTNLLLLVDADRSLLDRLRGEDSPRIVRSRGYGPFEITWEHVSATDTTAFVELLRRLLTAEAKANEIPNSRIHVASNVNAPDGGVDGSIQWEGGPDQTDYLPRRQVAFQLKNRRVGPSAAAEEVLSGSKKDSSRIPKKQVKEVIRDRGCYVVLCSERYVRKEIQCRERSIRKALRDAGLSVDDSQVQFRDADEIAMWVNEHPTVAIWVRDLTQPGTTGPFRTWKLWSRRSEHDRPPWVDDDRLAPLRNRLVEQVSEPRGVLHAVGLAGIGKTRLLLEAFGSGEADAAVRDLVMYADASEHLPADITSTVRNLADTGKRAIVVVDRCTAGIRRTLASMVGEEGSRLSLVTVQDRLPTSATGSNEVLIPKARFAVIEQIVDNLPVSLTTEDKRRLARFSGGHPEFAISMVSAWNDAKPLGQDTEHGFVMTFILSGVHEDPALVVKSAQLLATFGLLGTGEEFEGRLEEVARVGGLDADRLNEGLQHLADVGVARRRGRLFVLEPRPVGLHLAERQWKAWLPTRWDQVLTGRMDPISRVKAARQLRFLNRTEIAQRVVKHVCRPNGPLGSPERLLDPAHTQTLEALVEVYPRWVVDLLACLLNGFEDLSGIEGDARRNLVSILEKAAFPEDTFDSAAGLLLRLAIAENEPHDENATGVLADLFPMYLSNTAADARNRLRFLQDAANSGDARQRAVIAQALTKSVETEHFQRTVGAEIHGSRPSMDSWHPETTDEASHYLKACARLLAKLAEGDDGAGKTARYELAHSLRSFIPSNLIGIDLVEEIARQVRDARGEWTEAIEALELHLDVDNCPAALFRRVKDLIERLRPQDLERRTLYLVSQYPTRYLRDEDLNNDAHVAQDADSEGKERDARQDPGEDTREEQVYRARGERLRQDVASLADELVQDPITLKRVLPKLIDRPRSQANWLGECLATRADSALDVLEPVKEAYANTPDGDRNDDLLAGFLRGLRERDPEAVEQFKREAAQSAQLAGTLPRVCRTLGVTSDDVRLVLQALESDLLSPKHLQDWAVRDCFKSFPTAEQANLVDKLLAHSAEGFWSAIWIVHSQCLGRSGKLDDFLPQIRRAAETVVNWEHARLNGISDHYFEQVMKRALERGCEDPDAQAVASALADAFAKSTGPTAPKFFERLLPTLLKQFPDITWQFIGAAILAERSPVRYFEHVMRGSLRSQLERSPVITLLPEETLLAWCRANPGGAPAFAAATLPVLAAAEDGTAKPEFHPTLKRVIDEFGDREGVLEAVGGNMLTFTWGGSEEPRLRLYRAPLESLRNHKTPAVSRWAESELRYFEERIRQVRSRLEEQEAEFDT